MLTARLHARPARLAAALALVPALLVGGAGGAAALPEPPGTSKPSPSPSAESAASSPVVSSPLPVGEVSGSPSPEPTASPTELDEEPVAETSTTDPLIRLVWVAVAAGLLLGAAGAVGLYVTRKSRGVHR